MNDLCLNLNLQLGVLLSHLPQIYTETSMDRVRVVSFQIMGPETTRNTEQMFRTSLEHLNRLKLRNHLKLLLLQLQNFPLRS